MATAAEVQSVLIATEKVIATPDQKEEAAVTEVPPPEVTEKAVVLGEEPAAEAEPEKAEEPAAESKPEKAAAVVTKEVATDQEAAPEAEKTEEAAPAKEPEVAAAAKETEEAGKVEEVAAPEKAVPIEVAVEKTE